MRAIELRGMRSEVDPVGGEFESGDLCDVRSEDEREKTSAAVGVFEVLWRWRQRA